MIRVFVFIFLLFCKTGSAQQQEDVSRHVASQPELLDQRNLMSQLAAQLKNVKGVIYEMSTRFAELESNLSKQQRETVMLQKQVKDLFRRLRQQEMVSTKLQTDNLILKEQLNQQEKLPKVAQSTADKHAQEVRTESTTKHEIAETNGAKLLHDNVTDDGPTVNNDVRPKRFVVDREVPAAFHAVSDRGEMTHIGKDQTVVFENVLLNIGGDFHINHSLFIAEMPGVYMFSASILSFVNAHPEFSAAIVKNGGNLALIYGHSDNGRHDQGSVTVVTQLDAGDEVWVKLLSPDDGSIYGGRYTTFSGALLWNV